MVKLNVSYPANGSQKLFEFDDERKTRIFLDKRMGNEVSGDSLGDEWKGYVRDGHTRATGGGNADWVHRFSRSPEVTTNRVSP